MLILHLFWADACSTLEIRWMHLFHWLLGLVAWFSLRVREVPGSIPGAAHLQSENILRNTTSLLPSIVQWKWHVDGASDVCDSGQTYHKQMKWSTWVHSSMVRAADCRSAGSWFKSGCALLVLCCEWFGSQSPKHDTNASYTRRHLHIGGTHWKSLMGSAVVCNHCYHGKLSCISGLVVEYIVAIDVTRVRFPADAFHRLSFKALLNGVHWLQACYFQKLCEANGSLSIAIDQKAWNYGTTFD